MGNVCCRISHSNKLITFSDNNLESKMFCDSIVELNAMLIRIKDEHQSIDKNHHNIQRQNVFNQIRNQISLEHDKIQNRLKQIRRTRTNQIKIKRQEEKQKEAKLKKEKQIQKVKEQKEKEKVKESQKTIIQKQQNKEEQQKIITDAKKKWSLILGKSSIKSPVSDKTNASKSSTGKKSKKKPNGASKLSQIDNKLNMLTKEIELNLERNTEMASKKMAKMEKLQKKRKKRKPKRKNLKKKKKKKK